MCSFLSCYTSSHPYSNQNLFSLFLCIAFLLMFHLSLQCEEFPEHPSPTGELPKGQLFYIVAYIIWVSILCNLDSPTRVQAPHTCKPSLTALQTYQTTVLYT